MKRCSTSYIIREMQIKTIVTYHYTPVRMDKIQNTDNTKCWWGCVTTGTLIRCWQEYKMVQPLWKTAWHFSTKLSIPYHLTVMLLGIYPKMLKLYVHTITCIHMFIAALFIIAKTQKQLRCPSVGKWINQPWYIHTMEYCSVQKINEL